MITIEAVASRLSYNRTTGIFTWLIDCGKRAKRGNVAGYIDSEGYIQIKLFGKSYRAHRVAWLLCTGSWPIADIDHRNRIRSDNRWKNLRSATKAQNAQNLSIKSCNRSGFPGVSFHTKAGRYRATICRDRKCHHLGYFDEPAEAAKAYLLAKYKLHSFSSVPSC